MPTNSDNQRSRPFCLAASLGALTIAAVLATTGWSQEYKSDPVDAEANRFAGIAKTQCVRDASRYAADRAKFAEYFTKAYFPQMTGTSPEDLAKLGDARYNLFKSFFWATSNEQLQRDLTGLTFTAMAKILSPKNNPPYHPAVRYNAILIIGMLDEEYPREGANPRPSKPFPQATQVLTQLVDIATTTDRFAPPVILGAVIGLERHARFRDSLTPAQIQAMTAALLKLVNHDDPIQEMDRNAYSWLRVRAAGVLALLGNPGSNNNVHDAILKLVAELKNVDDRCAAVALLKKLDYKDAKLDAATTTVPLFELARDLGAAEAKRAREFQEQRLGSGGYAPSPRGEGYYGGGAYGEQEEQFPRRHVLARLVSLTGGLEAVKPALPAESQSKIDAVLAAIKPVISSAVDKNTVELKFTSDVISMDDAINQAVAPAEEAEAEAEEAEF